MRAWPTRHGEAKTLLIAEIAQAHDGSLGTAHAYIDAVAAAGASAIKFQTHIAEAESCRDEPWRVRFSPQDDTRFDYWKRMEFTAAQWAGLKQHADDAGLLFLSSAFSPEAVELLERVGIAAWKVASGEVGNHPLLRLMARTGRPVLLSSGMSPWKELDQAVELLKGFGSQFGILQCTSRYPTQPEDVGLNILAELHSRYACLTGLSDHSGTIYPGLAASTLGADILEVHVTFSREMFGPDVVASITTSELGVLAEGLDFNWKMRQSPLDKDGVAKDLDPMRALFTKSIVAARDLPAGHRLASGDLRYKKPGTGIPAEKMDEVLGRSLKWAVSADHKLSFEDLD